MKDIKDYLEQTNTVLLTKDAFEWLKERASALDKIRAEIEFEVDHRTNMLCAEDVFEIINKYTAESTSENPNKWIPVSERLPKEEGRYLTTIFNGIRYIMTCTYFPRDCMWNPDDECASDNVIAWMPLPEPYKAESEG